MPKTTTKTTTTTEKFDDKGSIIERITETSEESVETKDAFTPTWPSIPTYPDPVTYPWGITSGIVSTNVCTCGTGKVCYKHAALINTGQGVTYTLNVASTSGATPQEVAQVIAKKLLNNPKTGV